MDNSEFPKELIEQITERFNSIGLVKLTNTKLIDLNIMQYNANKILGWSPTHSLEDYIAQKVKEYDEKTISELVWWDKK